MRCTRCGAVRRRFAAWETAIDVAPRSEAAKMAQEKLDRLCKEKDEQPLRELRENRRY